MRAGGGFKPLPNPPGDFAREADGDALMGDIAEKTPPPVLAERLERKFIAMDGAIAKTIVKQLSSP